MFVTHIRVMRKGVPPLEMAKEIQYKFITAKDGIEKLGLGAMKRMRMVIKENTRRAESTGNLARSIQTYIKEGGDFVGVGYVMDMDKMAPYWYFQNYGVSRTGMKIPGRGKSVPGYFNGYVAPDASMRGTRVGTEKFHYTPGSSSKNAFFMTPKEPITPMNYIEKTKAWLDRVFKVHFYGWTKETKIHSR